jgi:hypothetical protein
MAMRFMQGLRAFSIVREFEEVLIKRRRKSPTTEETEVTEDNWILDQSFPGGHPVTSSHSET